MSTEIAIDMGLGGRFDHDETDAIITAAEQARDAGETAYLTLNGVRIAIIAPLPATEQPAAPEPGPAARYVSRLAYGNGTRQEVQAVQLTGSNYQRIIGWLQSRDEPVTGSAWDEEPPRLSFGGRRGSYSIPPGWWVLLYTPETTPARAGVEGWDPEDFEASWIEKSEQERADRVDLQARADLYRASRRG
jgi:hypothetical protein